MLFGKKKISVDELAEIYKALSDEDKEKFKESVKVSEEPKEPEEKSEEKIEEKSEENLEEKPEEQSEEKIEEKFEEKSEESSEIEESEEVTEEVETEDDIETSEEDADEDNKILEGFEARLKAIETALFSQKEVEKPADVGVSGFGKSAIGDETTRDTRVTDTIKKLGGRA